MLSPVASPVLVVIWFLVVARYASVSKGVRFKKVELGNQSNVLVVLKKAELCMLRYSE